LEKTTMHVFQGSKRRLVFAASPLFAVAFGPIGCSPQAEKATGTVLMTVGTPILLAEPVTGSVLLSTGGALHIHGAHRESQQATQGGD
jgi:hypothetical protein